jgi:hypothetical protein
MTSARARAALAGAPPAVAKPARTALARTTLAAAALGAALAVGACGSSHPALNRTQLIQRADAVCLKVNRQAAAAVAELSPASGAGATSGAGAVSGATGAGGASDARAAFIRSTEATLPLSDRGLAELRALVAPPPLSADWRRFLRDVQTEDAGEHQLVQAARSGDLRLGESTQVRMQGAASDLQQLTARDGFSVCGRPSER